MRAVLQRPVVPRKPEGAPARTAAGRTPVLVVEDDEVRAGLLRATLESAGYRAVVTADGFAAPGLVREHSPALVILDLNLWHPNSFELTQRLRQGGEGKAPKILGVVPSGEAELESKMRRAGVERFIAGRFDPDDLVREVRRLVEDER